jgi:hypothetical protein
MKFFKYGEMYVFAIALSFLAILFIPAFSLWAGEKEVQVIDWKGKVALEESFTVENGEKLVVWPGTEIIVAPDKKIAIHVSGALEIKGEKGNSVRFYPEGDVTPGRWMGIIINGSRENLISHCSFSGASSAVSLVNASVSINASSFENCRQGVEINQKALARIENCSFRKNLIGITSSLSGRAEVLSSSFESIREIGVVIQNGGSGRLEKCEFRGGKRGMFALTNAPVEVVSSTFASCEQGAVFRQVGKKSFLKHCTFANNSTGVLSIQFSFELISDCSFKNNKLALDIREFSSPHITHCQIVGNQLGINLFRKSNSLIDFNVLLNNRTGIEINFSSYPGIFNNNFERNDMHVKLGNFQSGDWEKRAGSKNIAGKEATRRGSRNIAAFKGEKAYPERVNAKGNFWGTDLGDFESGEMNLEKIWDGKDFGPVTYEGYGDEKYKIDHVDFSEWKREPVKEAGIRETAIK